MRMRIVFVCLLLRRVHSRSMHSYSQLHPNPILKQNLKQILQTLRTPYHCTSYATPLPCTDVLLGFGLRSRPAAVPATWVPWPAT